MAETAKPGTDLYRRMLTFDYGDQERSALMRKVWSPTPWIVDAYTGLLGETIDREIRDWLHDNLGDEAFPIRGRAGTWQRSGVTIQGWTWLGFASEELMKRFLERWPQEARDG